MSKKTHTVRVFWEMSADVEIEADSIEEAINSAANAEQPTQNMSIVPHSTYFEKAE